MFGLADVIKGEVEKALTGIGLSPSVSILQNELVIKVTKEEIINKIISGFPEPYRSIISVEAGDIIIKVKLAGVVK